MTAPVGSASPGWCVRLIAELDAADQRAKELVTGLSAEQLNGQPAPGAWSVGQCLEHLCATNEVYLAAISSSLVSKPVFVVQEITPGWFGRWFLATFVEPSPRGKRARAPKKIVPNTQVEASVLDRFLRSNQDAREVIRKAGVYNVNRIRFRNPLFPIIRFTVGTGFEIISKHESRHLVQAERAKQVCFRDRTQADT